MWKYCILVFCLGSISNVCISQVSAPTITATGNQLYCGDAPMPIVTDVTISKSSPGDNILNVVFVQISEGYTSGQDVLLLTGTHPNITSSWSYAEGELTLQGPATLSEFENAIRDVVFQTIQTNFTEDKYFSINLGNANYLPSTGHYYFYVEAIGISWTQARNAAANETYFGLQGYLATLTTEEEAQLAGEQSSGTGWIGGSDEQQEGTWRWMTGPEAGEVFWIGLSNGGPPNNEYSFWNTGEPNNFGDEDYAHITDPNIGLLGSWNDLPNEGDDPSSPYYPKGYIVEFGGMDGDPNITVSASTVIVTPKLVAETESICGEGQTQITVTTNTDSVLWYDSPSSTTSINSGMTYEVYLNSTTTFWLSAEFSGCPSGARIPVTITVFDPPTANDISIIQCDDEVNDGLSSFNIGNYFDEILEGNSIENINNSVVNVYEDLALTTQIDYNTYENITSPQTVYFQVTNTVTGCASVSQITLQVSSGSTVNASIAACDDFVVDGFTFFDLSEADDQILNSSPVNATLQYYKSYNDALLQANALPNDYFNEVAYNQTIYARVEVDGNCYDINDVNLRVKDIPIVMEYEEVYYCLNAFPETITLEGGVIGDVPNNYDYEWSTDETTTHIQVNEIGTYTVLVTEPGACTNKRTIKVLPSSTASIETIDIIDASENNTITVFISGEGEYEYALGNIEGPYQSSNVFENVTAGVYAVYVRDVKNNCGIASEDIAVIGFPKFFTPNGDTLNDLWSISGFSSVFLFDAKVQIFDRYGKLITELTSQKQTWDGRFNGELMPSDDYWFSVELADGRLFKGHFALKR